MRRRGFFGLTVALVTEWLAISRVAYAAAWEEMGSDEGIRVYRRDVPGSPLVAFKGTGMVDAPLGKIAWVLSDNAHRTNWVDRLKRSVVLEQRSAFDFILYQHFQLPPLISDRDYVYRAIGSRNPKTGVVTLQISSVTHPKAPPTVGVRARLYESRYVLTPKGDRTHVTVEIHTDPKGSLPAWLVNMIQKSWPMNTLQALRREVKQPYVKSLELP